ncbi:MAG: hypothetical protein D4R64_00790 [Porphyromonadaceae bacterium]|nr:MAG: hypothetical protein D4R64_00790 [Porphyromonadaceae bacterium]
MTNKKTKKGACYFIVANPSIFTTNFEYFLMIFDANLFFRTSFGGKIQILENVRIKNKNWPGCTFFTSLRLDFLRIFSFLKSA